MEKKRDVWEVKKRLKAFDKLQIGMKYLDERAPLPTKLPVYGPLECVQVRFLWPTRGRTV